MSYCRFSDDNWSSDAYAYQSEHGFELHVAARKIVSDVPTIPPFSETGNEEWLECNKAQMAAVTSATREPIGGPYDGMSFVYATAEELRDAFIDLCRVGYRVPQFAIDEIEDEIAEGTHDG